MSKIPKCEDCLRQTCKLRHGEWKNDAKSVCYIPKAMRAGIIAPAVDVENLRQCGGGIWGEDERYPVEDWQYEVANGHTRQGYWEWVQHGIEGDGL